MAGAREKMADFIQSNVTKSAVRELADPVADIAAYEHDRPVRHHDQPVCMCSIYDLRAEP